MNETILQYSLNYRNPDQSTVVTYRDCLFRARVHTVVPEDLQFISE